MPKTFESSINAKQDRPSGHILAYIELDSEPDALPFEMFGPAELPLIKQLQKTQRLLIKITTRAAHRTE